MRKISALVLVAALMAIVPAPPAAAGADQFKFFGGGFGHGLGLSQWGAYGLARQGWGATRIVTHFYSKTRVTKASSPPNRLRIGLFQGSSHVHLAADTGDVRILLGSPNGKLVATVPDGETWLVREAHGTFKILDATGAVVAKAGDENTGLVLDYAQAHVRIPEAGHTYNRGSIELALYDCGSACSIRAVLTIAPEDYLYGLGEVPSSWPMAAMKAQAIAARTYAFTKAAAGQHRPVCDCALYASSYDQVYAGWDKEGGTDGARWVSAVDGTRNEIVSYQGQSIQAFYMSSSGGFTEDNENVWGGTPIPYLRGVCDPGDYTTSNPNATWIQTISKANVTHDLGLGIGSVTGFSKTQRGVSGRIITTTVKGENGTTTISGSTLRSDLGLLDDRVWIDADRLITGPIRQKYDALDCSPGLATSRQVRVAGGDRQGFEDGAIYWSDATNAHLLSGDLLDFYVAKGGPGGKLGFPVADQVKLSNGGTKAPFEHGTIRCTAGGACQII
jgi:stage II sporulation protein D